VEAPLLYVTIKIVLVDYRIRQREFLLAISRALTSELELVDVLRIIVQASVDFISGQAGVIVLADPTDRKFRIAAVYGLPRSHFEQFSPLLQGFPYEDGAEREVIPDITERIYEVAKAIDIGVAQVLRLPMMSGETLIGMIYVFQSSSYRISSDAANLLQSFADQAAIAVKNARLYQEVIAEKQRLDAILEQNADGIMILDHQLTVVRFNPSLSRMTGLAVKDAVGKHHDGIFRWQVIRTDSDLSQALANGWPLPGAAHLYVEGDLVRPNGEKISLGVTYSPLMNHRGTMTNIIANVRDLTHYREEQELQKTFISVVSHELKTPVSIIKGFAGTLQRTDAHWPPEMIQENAAVIEEEADRLTDLIDNLLEASRLQSGTFKLNLTDEILLPKMASDTVLRLQNQANNHTFSINFPDNFPVVYGDERRLTQVFNNLIANAIKYSPDGGEIEISGQVHSDYVTVSVRDEGIGIPEHQQHKIFEKFSRLDNALSRNTEGTGLGLYLAKAIIEAHGGSIWFSRNAENDGELGTTFTFSLHRERSEDS